MSFNPHTHAGCDLRLVLLCLTPSSFNPHTHAGCDFCIAGSIQGISGFNPHTHAGCDRIKTTRNHLIRCFNPHTHAGCDSITVVWVGCIWVSIHTPTQGVTPSSAASILWLELFQSTHPRRVWLFSLCIVEPKKGFNPHTHAGCDTWAELTEH